MKFLHHGEIVTVLEHYDGHKPPGKNWVLIRYPNGHEAWCGNIWLEPYGGI